jgi:sulfite reductase alpha subunit-like flavoprotein
LLYNSQIACNDAGTGLAYEHGDHIAVYVHNSPETVAAAVTALGWDPATAFSLSIPPENPEMLPPPFPGPITITEALRHHVELLQHPDKAALAVLASCAADPDEAKRLRWLAGHDGKADFAQYIVHDKRSLIEVLEVCTSPRYLISFEAHAGLVQGMQLWRQPDQAALILLLPCQEDVDKTKSLLWLAGRDGKADFAQYIGLGKRSLIEVLEA